MALDYIQWLALLHTVAPVVLQVIPATQPLTYEIIHLIEDAERLAVAGTQKKTHVMAGTEQAIRAYNTPQQSYPLDAPRTMDAVDAAVDTIIKVIRISEQHPHTAPVKGQALS